MQCVSGQPVSRLAFLSMYLADKSTFILIYVLGPRSIGNSRSALGPTVSLLVLLCELFVALAIPLHHRNTVLVSWPAIIEGTNVGHLCQWLTGCTQWVMGCTKQGPTTFES